VTETVLLLLETVTHSWDKSPGCVLIPSCPPPKTKAYFIQGSRIPNADQGTTNQTGCALGTVASCFLAAHRSDKLIAVLSGLLLYEIASENAAAKDHVRGPGSFVPAFLDELNAIREATLKGDGSWFSGRAKIQQINL
jgi:hydroxyethylthiazole kinase-like sugar kinase family protein